MLDWLFGRGRDASGFSNCIVISLFFVYGAKPFRNFPGRLQFVKFGGTYPDLRVRFGVVYRYLQFQGVMIQSSVALREVHLFATRITIGIGPDPVVKTNGVDDECVSLPLSSRVSQPSRVGIFGKCSPVRPNGAPNV